MNRRDDGAVRIVGLVLLLVLITSSVWAEEYARTESGRRVLLHDDGTWEEAPVVSDDASEDAGEPTFRGVRWGATREDVIAAEGREPDHEEPGGLMYTTTIGGLDAIAAYQLVQDVVTAGFYIITERHSNKTDFVDDFEKLKGLLSQKYGEPESDRTIWKNDLYRDEPQDWGTAIAAGHLAFLSTWQTEETQISLMLSGDNYDISFSLMYESLELAALQEAERERESMEGL